MDKINLVKYTDAFFSHKEDLHPTKISFCESYGYAEKIEGAIVLSFAKGVTSDVHDKTMKGFIIPERNLISGIKNFNVSVFGNLALYSNISVEWSSVAPYSGEANPQITIRKTTGILERNEDDHLVIKNPKTKSIQPLSEEEYHGDNNATYYIIPKSIVLKIEAI